MEGFFISDIVSLDEKNTPERSVFSLSKEELAPVITVGNIADANVGKSGVHDVFSVTFGIHP